MNKPQNFIPTTAKPNNNQNAVVLLSGGLDSVTCLYWAKANFNHVTAVSFDYGQRHNSELNAAKNIAKIASVDHRVIGIDLAQLGGSALTDQNLHIPNADKTADFSNHQNNANIPITYVPARNTIFLSYALAVAEVTKANTIVIGVNAVDYSGYPDCRPEYIDAFAKMANLATKAGVMGNHLTIATPLLHLSKAEIIKLGVSLGVDYGLTVSCYQANRDGLACGKCDSCYLRQQGFLQAEIDDPTCYQ
ncbi:ExsB protein [Moraxella macacae 0408225]|uniref:7-cyano-7-deazaguanine synthase n=1 Tax=Moraxella macacae 0408225 TaxID=1230338 RepID=L2F777_9GAMM|nr:7-cyano-7-deazaguanine synthase QueC [Moraxella macacae]ELA08313.1 ExsB protein [Moraxella macacae 0408225]